MPDEVHLLDYAVLVGALLPSLGIAFMCACRQPDTAAYTTASLPALPLALSLVACLTPVNVLQGLASELVLTGMSSLVALLAVIGAAIAAAIFTPVFHPLRLASVYQYLEGRFQSCVPKAVATTLGILALVSLSAVSVLSTALSVEAACGLAAWATATTVLVLATLVSSLGGLAAVVWSNACQVLLVFSSVVVIIVMGLLDSPVLPFDEFKNRSIWQDLSNDAVDPLVRGSVVWLGVGLAVSQMVLMVQQPAVQRISAARSLCSARMVGCLGVTLTVMLLALLLGLGALVAASLTEYNEDWCVTTQTSSFQLLYTYVRSLSPSPGLSGLWLAAVFSLSVSGCACWLHALTAVVWEQLLSRRCAARSQAYQLSALRLLAFFIGLLLLGFTFLLVITTSNLYQAVSLVLTCFLGSTLGMFLCAVIFPFVGPWAVTAATLVSSVLCLWLSIGAVMFGVSWENPMAVSLEQTSFLNTSVAPTSGTTIAFLVNATEQTAWDACPTLLMLNGFAMESGPYIVCGLDKAAAVPAWYVVSAVHSLPPHLYPAVGLLTTVLLTLLFSVIPACRQEAVHPKYLGTCVRRGKYNYNLITEGSRSSYHANIQTHNVSVRESTTKEDVTEAKRASVDNVPSMVSHSTKVTKRFEKETETKDEEDEGGVKANPETDNASAAILRPRILKKYKRERSCRTSTSVSEEAPERARFSQHRVSGGATAHPDEPGPPIYPRSASTQPVRHSSSNTDPRAPERYSSAYTDPRGSERYSSAYTDPRGSERYSSAYTDPRGSERYSSAYTDPRGSERYSSAYTDPRASHFSDTSTSPLLYSDEVFVAEKTSPQRASPLPPPPPSPSLEEEQGVPVRVEINNNTNWPSPSLRKSVDPNDPQFILANILTGAHRSGERGRLISSTTRL